MVAQAAVHPIRLSVLSEVVLGEGLPRGSDTQTMHGTKGSGQKAGSALTAGQSPKATTSSGADAVSAQTLSVDTRSADTLSADTRSPDTPVERGHDSARLTSAVSATDAILPIGQGPHAESSPYDQAPYGQSPSSRSPYSGSPRVDGAREVDNERASLDLAAVERVRAGDLDAFRELFQRYESRARAIAYGVVGNRDDAEDVVQEAFLKAYRNISSFRGQSSFYTWFYRIVFNLSIDLSRKRYRKVESSLGQTEAIDALHFHADSSTGAGRPAGNAGDLLGHIDGPEDVVNRSDIRRSIAKALDGLSADHRAVIVLREIDGLSYSEISDVVGCSKGTVMSRLHHARRRMQRALSELLPWYEPNPAAGSSAEGSSATAGNTFTDETSFEGDREDAE